MESMVVGLLATGLGAVVLVALFTRRLDDPGQVDSWARSYGVSITARNGPMIAYFTRLVIVLRVVGGVSGILLGSLFDEATGLSSSAGWGFWAWVLVGWLAGTAWTERRLIRPEGRGAAASLAPRRAADYLSPTLRAAPFVAAGVTVAVAVAGVIVAPRDAPGWPAPSDRKLALAAAAAIGVAVVIGVLRRAVIARRQPVASPDVVAADDAVRANVLHHMSGAGTAAILLVCTGVGEAVLRPHQLPFGLRGWLPLLPLVGALVAWRFLAYRYWRVRRPGVAGPGPAVAP